MLFNCQTHGKHRFPRTIGDAGNRGSFAVVAACRHANVAGVGADAVGHIEPDPTQAVDKCLGPAVPGFLVDAALARGDLLSVLDAWRVPPIAVVLAYARSAYTPLRVKLMRDFLLERLSDQVA